MLPRPRVGPWPIHERRTVVAAVLALAGAILSLLDWSQLVVPIQQSFAAGAASELLLRQVPDIAGLLALPLIGVLAARNPPHRMLLFAGILLLAGGTTMAVAPTIEIFVPGLALLSVGRVVVLAVAVATVAEVVQDDLRRASAFATLGMIAPALEIGAPLGVAWLLGNHGWRAVGSVWAIAALLVLLSSRLADRRASGPPPAARRPWAPLMMGVALVGVVHGGVTRPVVCVELPDGRIPGRAAAARLIDELRALGAAHAPTAQIDTFLFHRGFPVDIRHNAKIFREQLARWASAQLARQRGP